MANTLRMIAHRFPSGPNSTSVDRLMTSLGVIPPTAFGPHVKVLNLQKGLPWADGSVSLIYSGELWEHFELADSTRLTSECFRVLAPGGVLRLCVPDGIQFFQRYLDLIHETLAQPRDARDTTKLRAHVQMYFDDICTRRLWLGSMGHTHKWQFDEPQLIEMFEQAGFRDVERMSFHDSRIPDISAIERSDFLIVEGVKPSA